MNFVICEIGKSRHIHYVVAIAQILCSDRKNKVTIVTHISEKENLYEIDNLENSETIYFSVDQNIKDILTKLNHKSIDYWFFPTLEPNSIGNLKLYFWLFTVLNKSRYVIGIHNTNLWQNSSRFKEIIDLIINGNRKNYYQIKIRFLSLFSFLIKRKVAKNKGLFFVVSENVGHNLTDKILKNNYTVIPSDVYINQHSQENHTSFNLQGLRIVIPGYISDNRRDYTGFLTALQNSPIEIKEKIIFDLLGKPEGGTTDGQSIIALAKELISEGFQINLYGDKFIPTEQFNSVIMKADIIGAFAVKSDKQEIYGQTKESGAPYLMVRLSKPGLLPAGYPLSLDLESSIIRYTSYQDLFEKIRELHASENLRETLFLEAKNNSLKYTPEALWKNLSKVFQ